MHTAGGQEAQDSGPHLRFASAHTLLHITRCVTLGKSP